MEVGCEKAGRTGRVGWGAALSVALALLIASQGCGGADAPPPVDQSVADTAPARKPDPQIAAAIEAQKNYRYDAANKPDPFRPFILVRNSSEQKESPLQRFDLAQLNLRAVVWNVKDPKAMVEDPSGRSHLIQVGTDIGKNRGKVTKIDDQEVQVRETYVDYLGHETQKNVTLRIVKTDLYGEES